MTEEIQNTDTAAPTPENKETTGKLMATPFTESSGQQGGVPEKRSEEDVFKEIMERSGDTETLDEMAATAAPAPQQESAPTTQNAEGLSDKERDKYVHALKRSKLSDEDISAMDDATLARFGKAQAEFHSENDRAFQALKQGQSKGTAKEAATGEEEAAHVEPASPSGDLSDAVAPLAAILIDELALDEESSREATGKLAAGIQAVLARELAPVQALKAELNAQKLGALRHSMSAEFAGMDDPSTWEKVLQEGAALERAGTYDSPEAALRAAAKANGLEPAIGGQLSNDPRKSAGQPATPARKVAPVTPRSREEVEAEYFRIQQREGRDKAVAWIERHRDLLDRDKPIFRKAAR